MREVTIATVQMKPQLGAMEDNLVSMSNWIKEVATKQKVDLIVFPELITTGYECGVGFTDFAQRIPGPSINLIGQRKGIDSAQRLVDFCTNFGDDCVGHSPGFSAHILYLPGHVEGFTGL